MPKKFDSIRKKVFSFFDKNPDASMEDLRNAFPEANKVSISNYRYQWKKENEGAGKKKSAKDRVFEYLGKNPTINFTDLRKALPAINPSSVSAYHSQWKKSQGMLPKEPKTRKTTKSASTQKGARKVSNNSGSNQELVNALRATIDAQQGTIEAMKMQNKMLKEKQSSIIAELEGLNQDQIKEIQKIMATYIKGMRKQ